MNKLQLEKCKNGKQNYYFFCLDFSVQYRKGKIIVDHERSHLIKKIFETYATGSHTLPEILKKTKEWGLRNSRGHQGYLCHSHLHSIITNPFYYGVMRVTSVRDKI